jgi:hypothetical protein
MSDVDEKKIEFVSDTDVSIPVRWKTAATDLRWNNAIAMAVTIARKIDTSNLWDGYLHFREKTGDFKINPFVLKTMDIEDGFICDIQTPIDISFTENVAYHYINSFVLTTSRITDNMPCVTGSVYSTDSTTIYIEMTNPITSISANENIKAFEITATFGGVGYTFNPVKVEISDVSRIKLTVTDMGQVSGEVNILYKSELGNIKESAYDAYIESFNRAFTYTMNYLEGE